MTAYKSLVYKAPSFISITDATISMAAIAAVGTPGPAVAHSFALARAGTIDRVLVLPTNTGVGTLQVRLESVSGSNPSNSLFAAGASGSAVLPGVARSPVIVTLSTPIVIASGDVGKLISVVAYLSAIASTVILSRTAQGNVFGNNTSSVSGSRSSTNYVPGTSGAWNTAAGVATICPLYTDDTPLWPSLPLAAAMSQTTVPASGANSYYGSKSTFDASFYLDAVIDTSGSNNTGAVRYEVYSSTNLLLATSLQCAVGELSSGIGCNQFTFANPPLIEAGKTYRIVKRTVSGVPTLAIYPTYSQAAQESIWGVHCLTSSSDGINWTDTPNTLPGIVVIGSPVAGSSRPFHALSQQVIG